MSDVLIRDIPDDVLAGLDAHAARLGLSRAEYIRRRLAQDASATMVPVSVADLSRFAEQHADLADPATMGPCGASGVRHDRSCRRRATDAPCPRLL